MKRPSVLRGILLLLPLALAAGFMACGPNTDDGQSADVYQVKVAGQMPIGHFLTDATDLFCRRAEEMSDGRLQFTHYPAGQLVIDMEMPDNIRQGTIEMGLTHMWAWQPLIPEAGLYYGPAQPENVEHLRAYSQQHLLPHFNAILETRSNAAIVGNWLATIESGYICTRPLRTPADFQGLKIRGTPLMVFELNALGAELSLISSADAYLALSQGVIDGVHTLVTGFTTRQLHEVAKHVTVLNLAPCDFYMFVNLDFWNSLPPDLQKVILDASQEAAEFSDVACLEAEEEARQVLRENGVDIYYPAGEAREAFKTIDEEVRKARYEWCVKYYAQDATDEVLHWLDATRPG